MAAPDPSARCAPCQSWVGAACPASLAPTCTLFATGRPWKPPSVSSGYSAGQSWSWASCCSRSSHVVNLRPRHAKLLEQWTAAKQPVHKPEALVALARTWLCGTENRRGATAPPTCRPKRIWRPRQPSAVHVGSPSGGTAGQCLSTMWLIKLCREPRAVAPGLASVVHARPSGSAPRCVRRYKSTAGNCHMLVNKLSGFVAPKGASDSVMTCVARYFQFAYAKLCAWASTHQRPASARARVPETQPAPQQQPRRPPPPVPPGRRPAVRRVRPAPLRPPAPPPPWPPPPPLRAVQAVNHGSRGSRRR